jgi:uncharacterized protein (TIGR02588 family)
MAQTGGATSRISATPIELTLGGLGVAAVAGIIGYLLLAGEQHESIQPHLRVELAPAQAGGSGWVVPFTLSNGTDAPAQQVFVEARLERSDGTTHQSLVLVDFLGGRSSAEGGFVFPQDPGAGLLTTRVLGFTRP